MAYTIGTLRLYQIKREFCMRDLLIILIGLTYLHSAEAAKILFIPANMNSHILLNIRLGESLTQLGHQVHILMPHNSHVRHNPSVANFTVSTYTVNGETPFVNTATFSKSIIEISLTESKLQSFIKSYSIAKDLMREMESDCTHLLENHSLMDSIRHARYDFAIMDPIAIYCYYVIPYSLGIPYATISIPWCSWIYRVPTLPSFATSLGYSDVMSFTERLRTFVFEVTQIQMMPENHSYLKKYAPDKLVLNVLDLIAKSSLYLFVDDIALGYARPQMPNTVNIGDIINNQLVHPLPQDLNTFVDEASPNSVIIVSFGSFLDHVPRDVANKFCEAFRRLQGHRVIWKLKYPEYCPPQVAPNVRVISWIPQNDLLANDRVHLFITHGGFNGLMEAIYHAKPVIVFPVGFDQPNNAAAVTSRGIGIVMNLRNFTTEKLYDNIKLLLTSDNNYTHAIHRASNILRDKPDGGAARRMSNLINHVIKHGDSHLRTGAFQMTLTQFFMLDIFMFLTVVATFLFVLMGLCARCLCRITSKKYCSVRNTLSRKQKKLQ